MLMRRTGLNAAKCCLVVSRSGAAFFSFFRPRFFSSERRKKGQVDASNTVAEAERNRSCEMRSGQQHPSTSHHHKLHQNLHVCFSETLGSKLRVGLILVRKLWVHCMRVCSFFSLLLFVVILRTVIFALTPFAG